ncbi:methyltransferase-like protein 24 [Chanos chanos]|uniref:Methyltransferase-like protein 24 n=1 Tax=Chanos chanos TaxID=29144 RepID=A0A6J2V4J8_CHACN|nr:methyltransferase-like protein 24 [Chanos chanos]
MLKEKLNRCALLRLCLLLSAVCLCLHLYVELMGFGWRGWKRGTPVPLSPKRPPRDRRGPTATRPASNAAKRTVSYVLVPKRDPGVAKATGASIDPVPTSTRLHRQVPRWRIELEPWASDRHSLEDEAQRFLNYITTPQVICEDPDPRVKLLQEIHEGTQNPWLLCLDGRYSLARRVYSKHCRVYSLGLGLEEKHLERLLAHAGCEVHCFDPSIREAHLQDADMWLHRLSVDWRDPNPAIPLKRQHSSTKKLATILNDFGHREVDVLKVDMESAEWKILENLILEGVLRSVGLLLLEVHLHWAGFEVGGDEPSVVRYWFSLLRELEHAQFLLYHSARDPTKPRLFLHRNLFNASSTYTLGWVNTQWPPR